MCIKFTVFFVFWLSKVNQVISVASNQQRPETLSKLVKDIIENEKVPAVLLAKTCWSQSTDVDFIRSFSIPTQIVRSSAPIKLPIDENTNKQWFFVDMSCSDSSNFLRNVDEQYLAHPYRWVIVDATADTIRNLTLLPDCNIILANKEENSKRYVLKAAYKVARNLEFIHEEYGFWSDDEGLVDLRQTRILSRRRRNLQGHQLRAATVFVEKGSENHTDLDDYRHNKADTISKISLLITQHLVDSVNATMIIDVHRTWGYYDKKTGFFTGMSGQLQRKDADIGGTIIFMIKDRVDFLEYLTMQVPTEIAFILRAPPISYVSNIYYLPFTGTVWLCSIALVVLCTIVIAATLKFHLIPDENTNAMEASDYILFAIASSCQMGSNLFSKVLSARISMFFFFIALLFIYTSFTANIVALLQSTTKSIRSISDLHNPAIGIGVADTPYNQFYFPRATEPSRKKLVETKVEPPNGPKTYMNVTQGMALVRQGMFAFHVEFKPGFDEMERTFFENEKCGLIEINFLGNVDPWCVIQKRSPYKEILKSSALRMREHGIQQRERGRVYKSRPKCDSDGKNFGSVRLTDCYAAMLILVYGYVAAFLIFCAEKVMNTKVSKSLELKKCFEE